MDTRFILRSTLVFLALVSGCSALYMQAISPGAKVTILGPGNKPVQLIAGKMACKAGYKSTVLVDDKESLNNARTLSYGRVYARQGTDDEDKVQFAVGAKELGDALKDSEGIIIATDGGKPLARSFIESAMKSAPGVKRVALLSAQGGSTGSLKETEDAVMELAAKAGAEFTIIRPGQLKGGGPGNVARGDDFGLDEYFYNTNPELSSFQKDKFSDQYLLGAKLTKGDNVKLNFIENLVAANSFSFATDGNSHRTTSAAALVKALTEDSCANMDFAISATRGLAPPSDASWAEALRKCAEEGVAITDYAPEDIPEAMPTPGQTARAIQTKANLGDAESSGEAVAAKKVSYKLGASSREEETQRKQLIGHVIPVAVTVIATVSTGTNLADIPSKFFP